MKKELEFDIGYKRNKSTKKGYRSSKKKPPIKKEQYFTKSSKGKRGKSYRNLEERKEHLRKQLALEFVEIRHKGWGLHKAWYEKTPTQPYRSGWEIAYMRYLDKKKIYYISNNTFLLPYFDKKKQQSRLYLPDFLIYKDSKFKVLTRVQEIKPLSQVNTLVNKAKFKVAERYCKEHNLKWDIITEVELKQLGALSNNYDVNKINEKY